MDGRLKILQHFSSGKSLLRPILFCSGGGFLYGFVESTGVLVVLSPIFKVIPAVVGTLLGATFSWGLAQHARTLGRRPVFLILLLANPYSWVAFMLILLGIAAWSSGPDPMNLGAAIGAMAFFFAFIYGGWLVLLWVFLKDPKMAAIFGGLSGGLFSAFSWGLWSGLALLVEGIPILKTFFGNGYFQSIAISIFLLLLAGLAFYLGWPRQVRS